MSQAERDAIRGGAEWAEGTTFVPTAEWRPDVDPYSAPITAPTSIRDGSSSSRTDGSEMVIPNYIGESQLQQSGMFGDVYRPDPSIWGREVSRPARVQIPSMIGGDFRFRSPQTIRRMTPTQRSMFQEGIKSFGIPWEDFSMQERMATSIGGTGSPSIKFRRPSFVRG